MLVEPYWVYRPHAFALRWPAIAIPVGDGLIQAIGVAMEPPDTRNAAEFEWRKDDVFDRIASRYDTLCDVFSLGVHRIWKRRVAKRLASEEWSTLLDGATGTGDIILRVLSRTELG